MFAVNPQRSDSGNAEICENRRFAVAAKSPTAQETLPWDYFMFARHPLSMDGERGHLVDGELLRPEFFGAPAQNFSGKYRSIGCERDLVGIEVRPLTWLGPRETAQDSALWVDLQDAPSYSVAHIKDVVRRDDKAKGMP